MEYSLLRRLLSRLSPAGFQVVLVSEGEKEAHSRASEASADCSIFSLRPRKETSTS